MTPEEVRLAACGYVCGRCGDVTADLYGHGQASHGRPRGVCGRCIGLVCFDVWAERNLTPGEEHVMRHTVPHAGCAFCASGL